MQPHASLPGYRTNAGLASMPGKAAPRVASFSAVMRVSCARAVRVGCLHHGLQQVPNACSSWALRAWRFRCIFSEMSVCAYAQPDASANPLSFRHVCTRADISPTLPAMQLTGKARPGHHQTCSAPSYTPRHYSSARQRGARLQHDERVASKGQVADLAHGDGAQQLAVRRVHQHAVADARPHVAVHIDLHRPSPC